MTRSEQKIRNRIGLAIGMTLAGITFSLYGFDTFGAFSAVGGMALLALSVHRFGRIGEDA